MPQKLKNLIVNRVALVDAGANPAADIVLFKRKSVQKATFSEVLEAEQFREVVYEVCNMTYTLQDAIWSSLYADGDRAEEIRTSVKQFSDAVEQALSLWLNGKTVAKQQNLPDTLAKIRERLESLTQEDEMPIDVTKLSEEEKVELRKALGITEAPAPAPAPTPAPEDVMKSLPKEARELIEKAQTDAAAAKKSADEAIAKQRESDERVERMRLEKRIADEFPNLPGTTDEKVAALKAANGNEQLEKMLKAGEAAVAKALLTEKGSSRPSTSTSALEKIHQMADELVTKGTVKNRAQGVAKIAASNPELYRQYREEQRG
jgi:hypothetical protein